MKAALALVICIAVVAVSEAADARTQFYAPPLGSPQEVAAQNMYFERSSKIIVGLQQAHQWMNYGQIEGFKAYKSGLFEDVMGKVHPQMLEEDSEALAGLEQQLNKDGKACRVIPALPENKAVAEYMKANEKNLEEQFLTGKDDSLEMQSTMAKIAALKIMHIQLYMGSGDVQKSYWTTKLMQLMAPPQLAYFSIFKGFLNTVALSVLMQIHDSYTLEAYVDNFNDDFNSVGELPSADFAEAAAEYSVYSSWTALAGIKIALLYIDFAEMSTTMNAMQAAHAQMMQMPPQAQAPAPAPVPAAHMASLSTPEVNIKAQVGTGTVSLLELELKAEPAATATDAKFTSSDPQAAYQSYVQLQYYVSLLKYYNLMAEFQLANTGSTVASYKLMSLRILTDGDASNDGVGDKLDDHAEILEGVWLPQMYSQWAQINMFTYMMDAYLMYMELTISTQMTSLASFMSTGGDVSTQMESVRAANAMESMNF